jgi:DNA-damage-inducible protein D
MSDNPGYDERFGLDMPLGEAVERFVDASMQREGEVERLSFKGAAVRKVLHNGEWQFSIVDIVGALTGSERSGKYWSDLKRKLVEKEGFSELSAKIGQLPLPGPDGKNYLTDVSNLETILRIVQSIQSPKAEPLKRWLARVGFERVQEERDPELTIRRAIFHYQLQGRSDDWIERRIRSVVVRTELTSEWHKRGIAQGREYAILTNIIAAATFGGVTVSGHRQIKGLGKNHDLRDHMTDLELIFTMLGEKSTTEIARVRNAQGFRPNLRAAEAGGNIAGSARSQLERETGERVVSSANFLGNRRREADPQRLTSGLLD